MKFLFDASSVFQVIRNLDEEKALRVLNGNCILDLTKYEVGNALWKERVLHQAIAEDEFQEFLKLFKTIILRTKVLVVDAENLSDIAEVAAKERATFYDASYITIAKMQDLTLITEDGQLAKVASKYTKAAASKDIPSF